MQPNSPVLANVNATDDAREMVKGVDAPLAPPKRLEFLCAADVAPERVLWLWRHWLPFGKLVDFTGSPGLGKSTAIIDLMARASRGGPMPYSDDTFPPVRCLIAGVEDGWADTIRPRLDAAAANLANVHFVTALNGHTFTIPRDVPELIERAKAIDAKWLHIDAIYGALDEKTNAHSDHEVRRALGSIRDEAAAHGIVVTYIRHPRKAGGTAVNAGGGSVAFGALARVGLFVGFDPHDKTDDQNARRRVLAVSKSNMAPHPMALAFTVESTAGELAGHIAWHGPVSVTADELAAPVMQTPEHVPTARPDPRRKEREWLEAQLIDGMRIAVDDLKAAARRDGLAWHRVKRAGDDAGVSKERTSTFPATTEWYFPFAQSAQWEHSEQSNSRMTLDAPAVPTMHREQSEHPSPVSEIGVTTAPTVPTGGMVRAVMHDGTTIELPADHRDVVELPYLFVRVEDVPEVAALERDAEAA